MPKLLQIHEDDLADLENALPEMADAIATVLNPRLKTKIRRVQKILSDVRWNYGPPAHIEAVSDGEEPSDQC